VVQSAKKILIVDDNAVVRDFLQHLCNHYELPTVCAVNGREAIDIANQEEFCAILMDLDMPVMGGIEAARSIRRREKEKNGTRVPILALSGNVLADPRHMCLEAGMDGFLAKPIEISSLLDFLIPLL
jgi:CheY-like chemotaxis protein